jgi:hypothetical protein
MLMAIPMVQSLLWPCLHMPSFLHRTDVVFPDHTHLGSHLVLLGCCLCMVMVHLVLFKSLFTGRNSVTHIYLRKEAYDPDCSSLKIRDNIIVSGRFKAVGRLHKDDSSHID